MYNLLTILPGIIWDLESLGLLWDTTGPLGILIHYIYNYIYNYNIYIYIIIYI